MAFDNSQQNGKRKWVNYKDMNREAIPSPLRALRVPPQNIDAEMALLGSIMLRPLGLNEIIINIS